MDQRTFATNLRKNMTDAERLLWRHLRAHRLAGEKFRRQQSIGPYVVDFVHFGARLIVEADGGQHGECASDEKRDAWLAEEGFRILRFWNNEILNETEAVLEVILDAVSEAPSPLAPLPRGERGKEAEDPPARERGEEAELDAETQFRVRAARGRGKTARGLELLEKAKGQ